MHSPMTADSTRRKRSAATSAHDALMGGVATMVLKQ